MRPHNLCVPAAHSAAMLPHCQIEKPAAWWQHQYHRHGWPGRERRASWAARLDHAVDHVSANLMQHGQHGNVCLAGAGGGANQDVLVAAQRRGVDAALDAVQLPAGQARTQQSLWLSAVGHSKSSLFAGRSPGAVLKAVHRLSLTQLPAMAAQPAKSEGGPCTPLLTPRRPLANPACVKNETKRKSSSGLMRDEHKNPSEWRTCSRQRRAVPSPPYRQCALAAPRASAPPSSPPEHTPPRTSCAPCDINAQGFSDSGGAFCPIADLFNAAHHPFPSKLTCVLCPWAGRRACECRHCHRPSAASHLHVEHKPASHQAANCRQVALEKPLVQDTCLQMRTEASPAWPRHIGRSRQSTPTIVEGEGRLRRRRLQLRIQQRLKACCNQADMCQEP